MQIVETLALGEVQRSVLEAVVLSVKNLLDSISLGAFRIIRVSFPFPAPGHASLARERAHAIAELRLAVVSDRTW